MLPLWEGVAFKNTEAATLPAGAVAEFVSAAAEAGEIICSVKKPTSTGVSKGNLVVCGPVDVEQNNGGTIATSRILLVKCDTSYSTGDSVGPVASQWYMSSAGSGYIVLCADPAASFPNAHYVVARGGGLEDGFAVTPVGGIGPRIDFAPGRYIPASSSCALYEWYDPGAGSLEIRAKSPSETGIIYNITTSSVGSNKLIAYRIIGGRRVVDIESCGTT